MKILQMKSILASAILATTISYAGSLSDAQKQDYINELTGTHPIKWFFWMTNNNRVFIADTRAGEDANSVTLWEHSLTNFTWTPISGGSADKLFSSISISTDGRNITLSTDGTTTTSSSSSSSSTSTSMPTKFTTEWLSGKTLYHVWYVDPKYGGSGVNMYKEEYKSDGKVVLFDLKGSLGSSEIDWNVLENGSLKATGGEIKIVCGSTNDYIKTHYLVYGSIDTVDLFFLDEKKALDYANSLTASIPECTTE